MKILDLHNQKGEHSVQENRSMQLEYVQPLKDWGKIATHPGLQSTKSAKSYLFELLTCNFYVLCTCKTPAPYGFIETSATLYFLSGN